MKYEETPRIKQNKKITKVPVMDEKEYKNNMKSKETKNTINQHKASIKKAESDIKKYKLLIKQVKITDKLNRVDNKPWWKFWA